jgi:hypothetical protein
MHALIVFAFMLHLLAAIKPVPPEKDLSTGTLVALLIIKINSLFNVMLMFNDSISYKIHF